MKASPESRTGPVTAQPRPVAQPGANTAQPKPGEQPAHAAEQPGPSNAHSKPGEQREPTRLGKYPLLGVIRHGSMASVYRSADPDTGRALAIKAVRRDLSSEDAGENLPARLRIEAELAGGLSHPGIVAVHEYGEDALYSFLVMEYVEGDSLRECFERKMSFGVSRSIAVVAQVLEALQYAHERGVWHRDIKPSNILIGREDQVKLTDFGIARLAAPVAGQMDAILGSPGYIAPESYLGERFDGRVDVFSAGAILYELLAGIPAFAGTADQVMFKVCHGTPLPPSIIAGMSSLQPYDGPVLKALARRPDDRFSSAAQFREALLAVAQTRRSRS